MFFIALSIVSYVIYAFASAEFMYPKTWFSVKTTFESLNVWLIFLFIIGTYTLVDLAVKTVNLGVFVSCHDLFLYYGNTLNRDLNEDEINELKRLHKKEIKTYKHEQLKKDEKM